MRPRRRARACESLTDRLAQFFSADAPSDDLRTEQSRVEGLLHEEALCLILVDQICARTGRERTTFHRHVRELLAQLGVVELPHIADAPLPHNLLE